MLACCKMTRPLRELHCIAITLQHNNMHLFPAQVEKPSDLASAGKLVFPGVGSFGQAMRILKQKDLVEPLKEYINVSCAYTAVIILM